MRFITGGRSIPAEDVRGISDRSVRMWDDHGYGPWAAIDKATGLPALACSVAKLTYDPCGLD